MASSFDARALIDRSLADVLDWIGQWRWGVGPGGPMPAVIPGYLSQAEADESEAFARLIAPLITALRSGALRLVGADGQEVPRRVWFAARWKFYPPTGHGVARLVDEDPQGHMTEYFAPVFAPPQGDYRAISSESSPHPDDAWVEKAVAFRRAGKAKSDTEAAKMVYNGVPVTARPGQPETFIDRIRKKMPAARRRLARVGDRLEPPKNAD
jgi:hypothetical protein